MGESTEEGGCGALGSGGVLVFILATLETNVRKQSRELQARDWLSTLRI